MNNNLKDYNFDETGEEVLFLFSLPPTVELTLLTLKGELMTLQSPLLMSVEEITIKQKKQQQKTLCVLVCLSAYTVWFVCLFPHQLKFLLFL